MVVGVLPGPHANPDYFTDDAMDVFYSSPYQVHYNSNRSAQHRPARHGTVSKHPEQQQQHVDCHFISLG